MARWQEGKLKISRFSGFREAEPISGRTILRLSVFPSYPFRALAPALERSEGMEKLKN